MDLLGCLPDHLAEPGVLRPHPRGGGEWGTRFHSADQVKFTLFQRFDPGAAGDRHLVEFLPGFTRSPEELFRWGSSARQSPGASVAGEAPGKARSDGRSGAAAAGAFRRGRGPADLALLSLGDLVTNVNLANRGQVENCRSMRWWRPTHHSAATKCVRWRPALPSGLQP